jgi:toxin YoeB
VNIVWSSDAWDDYVAMQSLDPDAATKVNVLIKEIRRDNFAGLGKPEPLKGDFQGFWSRRITSEHRLVYRIVGKVRGKRIEIAQCRFHYRS